MVGIHGRWKRGVGNITVHGGKVEQETNDGGKEARILVFIYWIKHGVAAERWIGNTYVTMDAEQRTKQSGGRRQRVANCLLLRLNLGLETNTGGADWKDR